MRDLPRLDSERNPNFIKRNPDGSTDGADPRSLSAERPPPEKRIAIVNNRACVPANAGASGTAAFDTTLRFGAASVVPPLREVLHNIELEQAMLGAIFTNNEAYRRVSKFLKPQHFLEPVHQKIFEVAARLIGEGKVANPITVKTFLPANINISSLNINQYLARLTAEATTVINAADYGRSIYDLAIRRSLIEIGEEIISAAYDASADDPPIRIADGAVETLSQIARPARLPLQWLNMSTWDTEPLPERPWAIFNRVPLYQAGLFSGEGGTGKSIIELHKDVGHVAGKDWLGSLPERGPAFYIGAEDEKVEIHIRLAAIAKHCGVTFEELTLIAELPEAKNEHVRKKELTESMTRLLAAGKIHVGKTDGPASKAKKCLQLGPQQ